MKLAKERRKCWIHWRSALQSARMLLLLWSEKKGECDNLWAKRWHISISLSFPLAVVEEIISSLLAWSSHCARTILQIKRQPRAGRAHLWPLNAQPLVTRLPLSHGHSLHVWPERSRKPGSLSRVESGKGRGCGWTSRPREQGAAGAMGVSQWACKATLSG